jgi:LacI family transcriptional regulator
VAVLGIGNDELICELSYPPLSSVALPTREIGRRAAEILESFLHYQPPAQRHWLIPPQEVIVRASTDRIPSAHPAVMAAMEFIRNKSHQPIGTDQVATAVGMPRRTLERRFQAALGKTVHDFLVEVRLRHARQLLRQSDAPLGEVARRCGYSALSAFTRMFTQCVGCHPEVYRKKV